MSRNNCEECKRPVVCVGRGKGKKRSRKSRAGVPVGMTQHSLCAQCHERLNDSLRRVR